MAYTAWVDGEDPELGDGVIWNQRTPQDAAEQHVDEYVIPRWGDYGNPKTVIVHVMDYDDGDEIESFAFDILVEPTRGFCKKVPKKSTAVPTTASERT